MCDCLNEVEKQIKEKYKKDKNQEIESVTFQVNLFNSQTYSDVYIKFKDKKKQKTIVLAHCFCPICGEKYERDEMKLCEFPGCNIFGCTKPEHEEHVDMDI